MKRRDFLKLACAAIVAPSLPILKKKELTVDELTAFISRRRKAAMLALLSDLEAKALPFGEPGDICINGLYGRNVGGGKCQYR